MLEERCLLDAGVFRSIDGTGNNTAHPLWGSTNIQLLRNALPAAYGPDGHTPSAAVASRPSARLISNVLADQHGQDVRADRPVTAFAYIWGQFLDHDLDLTQGVSPSDHSLDIPVPRGDPSFDPAGLGNKVIPLNRSRFDPATGTSSTNPRQQINQITAFIDGSMVYGSDSFTANALRTHSGGKLKTSPGPDGIIGTRDDLPPLNNHTYFPGISLDPADPDAAFNIANDAHLVRDSQLFMAGDVRANENVELTSMHTLFIREHNRLATLIAARDFAGRDLSNPAIDEAIYQRARAIVGAELQVITYKEWLPALLGLNPLPSYAGYNPAVNPGIANEFSTAGFRLHTLINNDVEFFRNNGRRVAPFTYVDGFGRTITVDGEVELSEAFFNPPLLQASGIGSILKYAASTLMQEFDNQVVDSLRNFLFGPPGSGGLDLASLNIQRGRDHGLADYNTVRAAYGLPRVTRYADITSDRNLQAKLASLYDPIGGVNNIDLWVGALAENHVPGTSTGPLVRRIMQDQFRRLRDGDSFWYQRAFADQPALLAQLENTTLADVIRRNTTTQNLQDNVFFFRAEVRGQVFFDRNGDGNQDLGEIGIPGVLVQLLNDNGDVVASTRTNLMGRYSFDDFAETGDYQVRVVVPATVRVTSANPLEFLIDKGDVTIRNQDFGLRLADPGTESFFEEYADIITAVRQSSGG